MADLQECRKKIDEIDTQLLRLFEERMKVCEEVAEYKLHTGKKVFDPERERAKLEALKSKAHGEANALGAQELFSQIMAISRKRQYQLLEAHGVLEERTEAPFMQGQKVLDTGACILYRDFDQGEILGKLEMLRRLLETEEIKKKENREIFYQCVNRLVEMAGSYGFTGNLWHCYLTYLLVNHENAFSRACEIRGETEGSLQQLALHDFEIFRSLYQFDLKIFDEIFDTSCMGILTDYKNTDTDSRMFNKRIRDRICEMSKTLALAETTEEFEKDMVEFYKDFGVGKLGLHKAFRVAHGKEGEVVIEPITKTAHVQLEDLVGYELPKKKLIENTEAFVSGKKANNCLLFGDAGTGKSSCIKGILNRYYDRGLRIIEIYKHQFQDLNQVIAQIKNRNYKFIIYMDDLSFEEFEIEYKYLKAVIEGGLEKKPDNILIYATSNRRHLVRERAGDKLEIMDEDDLHSSDTVQEKLSLVYRFGVRIYFGAPSKKEFQNIVKVLAQRHEVTMPEEELLLEANKWELSHGGLTGRTAQQFVDHILGTM